MSVIYDVRADNGCLDQEGGQLVVVCFCHSVLLRERVQRESLESDSKRLV